MASLAHGLLFSGFVVLCIGTTLIAIEHVIAGFLGRSAHNPVFHYGIYYAVFEFVMDTFGIAFLLGIGYFANRRRNPPSSVSHERLDWVVLASLFAIEFIRVLSASILGSSPMPQALELDCGRNLFAAFDFGFGEVFR